MTSKIFTVTRQSLGGLDPEHPHHVLGFLLPRGALPAPSHPSETLRPAASLRSAEVPPFLARVMLMHTAKAFACAPGARRRIRPTCRAAGARGRRLRAAAAERRRFRRPAPPRARTERAGPPFRGRRESTRGCRRGGPAPAGPPRRGGGSACSTRHCACARPCPWR